MHWLNRCSAFSPDTCRFWDVMEAGNDSFAPQFSISENLFQYKGFFAGSSENSFSLGLFLVSVDLKVNHPWVKHLNSFNILFFFVRKQRSYDN